MGTMSSTATKNPPLKDRLNLGKATGRLRLIKQDDVEKALSSSELVALKTLDMSNCDLKTLPKAIGTSLVKIQQLKLNDNPKLKNLPIELAALKELRKLECIGCSSLSSLEVLPKGVEILELAGCSFTGLLEHPWLPLSSSLQKLDLSNNYGVIGFGKAFGFEILTHLTELNLDDTSVEFIPADIGHLKSLSILKLVNTKIKSLPESLFRDTPVSRLELKGTLMTKDQFLSLPGVEVFMDRRKDRIDREIAGKVFSVDRSVCGLD
jgi:Leucine-rich repeat (LRR) protein